MILILQGDVDEQIKCQLILILQSDVEKNQMSINIDFTGGRR